jgi:hypothetical protein
MRITRRGFFPAAAGLLAGCGSKSGNAPGGPVELTPITYAGLDAAVKEQAGKVVLIEMWFLA